MSRFIPLRASAVAALAVIALLVAACGTAVPPSTSPSAAATTPSASPTQAPTPSPSPVATPDPTESASPSEAVVDPTEDLTIGPPYALAPLDRVTAAALEAGMAQGLGAMGDLVEIGARTVNEDGTEIAYVMAMAFPDMPVMEDPAIFSSILGSMAQSTGGTVEETEIAGKVVGLMESPSTSMAVYQDGATIIMVIGTTPGTDVTGATEALIEANG